jgi:hypothetical protein
VQIARRRQAEQPLQVNLPRRVVGQVFTAHDIGDALRGIVHHHRELVRPRAVGALQHEVADGVRHVLFLRAQAAVVPGDANVVAAAQAPRTHWLAVQATAAGAGIDDLGAALCWLAECGEFAFDLAPRAAAGVGEVRITQPLQRALVGAAAL